MICQNCQANVDDDLIFCTNCGERIIGAENQQTIAMNDSVVTQISSQSAEKKSSGFKWIILIIALIIFPAVLFGAYIFLKSNNSANAVQNSAKPSPANRKTITNVSNNAVNNTNSNISDNTNSSSNGAIKIYAKPVEIFNEQIEIAAGEHIAYPFKLDSDAKVTGELQTVRGEAIHGFVYFQKEYDEHFPDATFKVFDFEGANPKIEQTLVAGEYVLVFLNQNQSSTTIKGKFSVAPEEKTK